MTLILDRRAEDGLSLLAVSDTSGRWKALICSTDEPGAGRTLLTPLRLFPRAADETGSAGLDREIIRQTVNLRQKIEALDRLALTQTRFSSLFEAGRIFIYGDVSHGEAEGWEFGRRLLRTLQDTLGVPVVAQTDYDQRRLHPHLGGALDSIDFKTKHDPSAVATTVAFGTVLERLGCEPGHGAWVVKGAGELGTRIVERSVGRLARTVHVVEQLPDRLRRITRTPGVLPADGERYPELPVQAVVFAADAGSLTMATARRLAANPTVRAVGGPEAALDHDVAALDALAAVGKNFVPSVLCGSLGLVANLEESLGLVPDVEASGARLAEVVAAMVELTTTENLPFHEVCTRVLRGRLHV